MKTSSISTKFVFLIIVFAVAIVLQLRMTTLTGASSIPPPGREASSPANEIAPVVSAALKPALLFATYTVNSLGDTGAGSGMTGDLRYCITQANLASGTNTINFSVTGTITLLSALPAISSNLTIDGPGANLLIVSGNNAVRVFLTEGANNAVTFSNLTIADGLAPIDPSFSATFGGGVYNTTTGAVNITNCVVRNCSATVGAGIFNQNTGTINITNSTVRNNSSTGSNGGGLFNNVNGTINVIGSTFNNNHTDIAGSGGGIFNNDNSGSHINLTNSTFSNNSSLFGFGGGFANLAGAATVTNCTFTKNSASTGGGLYKNFGTMQLKNSLLAQNSASTGPDLSGAITSMGYNLIGNNGNVTASFPAGLPNANKDYVGTSASPINALLAPLTGNGGPTFTHALLSGSPAIDKGSSAAGVTTDQRGSPRPSDNPAVPPSTGGNDSDIGAFETQSAPCGNLDFGAAMSFAAGSIPIHVAVGDFNLDGQPDLAVANLTSNDVSILLNNGSGGFTQPTGSPLGPFLTAEFVAVGDFNLDSNPDLAVLNGGASTVTIMLGNGSGGFTLAPGSPVNTGSASFPFAMAIGDFNLDGNPDIATANGGSNNATILLGNGSGGFVPAAGSPFAAGTRPRSIAAGDFNLDTKLDIAVANETSGNVTILLGNGSGGFTQAAGSPIATGASLHSVTVADFNLDNKPDLAVANQGSSTVTILLGNGSGGFAQPAGSPITGVFGAFVVAPADFNNDGKPDLAVQIAITGETAVLIGNGSGGFSTHIFTIGVNPQSLAVGDFNLDGKPDLATANFPSNDVSTLLNICVTNQFPIITAAAGLSRSRGNPATGSQIATVSDPDQAANSLIVTVDGAATATVNGITVNTIAIDAGGNVTASIGASCMATDAMFTLTVTDSEGTTATAILTVTATPDSQASVIGTCPANIIQGNDPNLCAAVVTFTAPTATDNCGSPTVTCSPASGTSFAKGTTTVTCTATDAVGNMSNCTFSVTINDTQTPAITCPANVTQSNDPGQCAAVVNYTTPAGSDNCALPSNPVVCTPASGSTFQKGATTVNCVVTDGAGLTANCSFIVTVNDTQAPVIACPANVTVSNTAGQCTGVATYDTPQATDNCSNVGAVNCTPASGSTFPKGTTTVTCTVQDPSGNNGSCAFTVTVNDTQAPVTSCPANITRGTDSNQCSAVVTYSNATATDNCANVGTPVCTPPSGSTFPKGTTTVNCDVSDASGNPGHCSFMITVNDVQNPSITCPSNILFTTPGANDSCGVVNYSAPTAGDNCPLPPNAVVCTPAAGSCFALGMTTVNCTVTDGASLTASCSFKITVQNPCAIACPANITMSNDANQCGAVVTFAPMITGGGCGTVTCSPASGAFFPKGTTTVNCTTQAGPSCSFSVTVNDTQAPAIVCPANMIKNTDADQCSAVVTFSVTATDNCMNVGTPMCTPASGSLFPKGTTTVNCTVNDSSNNPANCSFTVTVNDTQSPVITCPANVARNTDQGQCSALVSYASATATDNCPNVGVPACSPASGTNFPKGTTTVNCSVSDASGNQSSCSFTVIVNDNEKPVVSCPTNMTKPTDANQCSAVVTFPATATDNCPGSTVNCNPGSGSAFPKGTTTVTCTATDTSGNSSAPCSFTVTINDTQPPGITCPANITKPTDPNLCSSVVTYAAPVVSDNCPNVGAPVCTPPSGTAFGKGTSTVSCTVKDASNNQSACSFTVTVDDTQLPSVNCPANQTRALTNPTDTTVVVTYTAPVFGDNCPGATLACIPPSGAAMPLGVTTVICTATDTASNKTSCSFSVTVFDVCLQDDSSAATVLLFNSITGDYLFCCGGTTWSGRGTVQKQGSIWILTHNTADRRVSGRLEGAVYRGTASLQSPPGTTKCTISDRDTRNNSCQCVLTAP